MPYNLLVYSTWMKLTSSICLHFNGLSGSIWFHFVLVYHTRPQSQWQTNAQMEFQLTVHVRHLQFSSSVLGTTSVYSYGMTIRSKLIKNISIHKYMSIHLIQIWSNFQGSSPRFAVIFPVYSYGILSCKPQPNTDNLLDEKIEFHFFNKRLHFCV